MKEWNNDKELFELVKGELYTPVIGDILDGMGYYHQILFPEIQSALLEMKIAGRAMPGNMIDVYGEGSEPFGKLTEALDQLQEGDVYIAHGGNMRCAYWGEILTATAKKRGAAGAVINGYHRDTKMMLEQDFPVFSRGRFAQDSSVRTKIVDYRCPIEIGAVWINPGDLVVADMDGVLIVPKKIEEEVIAKSLEKVRAEKKVREEIENGMSSTEAFKKYGVL